ncbi:MAG: hypothetical protein E6J90_31430 [Deltaproteobacteria bacterium]|nr:MAG: hypothetical protein E6J91_25300 [Deltaproteobacteria bacterium]TMQ12446.1 MAG: hypothetical protein E6J90_31430 [Deltaproteobacteria bacterium]
MLALLTGACAKPTPTRFTTGGDDVRAEPARTYRWGFDDAAVGDLPTDYISVLGDWKVESDPSAPSAPNVLRQTGAFKNPDFPRVLVKGLTFTDLTMRVRCRPEKGDVDRACGLVFRAKDSDNYYLTRANALEDNVRLYRVVNGDRQQFASADLKVTAGEWHTLEATARGAKLEVSWDGRTVLEASDATFVKGKIGLWTKADSVTAFDDLEAVAR